jgi:Glycosyltransferase
MVQDTPFVILHITAPARVGGLERVVSTLAGGHAQRGHKVHVAAVVESVGHADRFLNLLAEQGVHTHAIIVPSRAYRRERAAVGALCREIRPTVVHTHGYRPDVVSAGGARRMGVPTVSTVHGFTGGGWRNRLYEKVQILALRRFDAVVSVSRPLASVLQTGGVRADRIRVLPNAWASSTPILSREVARSRLGLPPGEPIIGWIGRLSREKGADVLLDACSYLDEKINISFIGDGPEGLALTDRAREVGVAPRSRWHGLVHDAGSLLKAFDAFVLSSRTEGTPITLLEAMAARVPIVATRVGGVPDMISDADAILVASEDASAIAAAIQETITNRDAASVRAASAALRLDREFAMEPWLSAYERVYADVSCHLRDQH